MSDFPFHLTSMVKLGKYNNILPYMSTYLLFLSLFSLLPLF